MNNCIKNMKPRNAVKKSPEGGTVRTTIQISDDVHPDHSEKVRARMKELRRRSYSNYIENLIADDVKSAQLQEAAA